MTLGFLANSPGQYIFARTREFIILSLSPSLLALRGEAW